MGGESVKEAGDVGQCQGERAEGVGEEGERPGYRDGDTAARV